MLWIAITTGTGACEWVGGWCFGDGGVKWWGVWWRFGWWCGFGVSLGASELDIVRTNSDALTALQSYSANKIVGQGALRSALKEAEDQYARDQALDFHKTLFIKAKHPA